MQDISPRALESKNSQSASLPAARSQNHAAASSALRARTAFRTALALVFLLPALSFGQAQNQPQAEVPSYIAYLTADLTDKIPIRSFDCRKKVYIYFTWLGLKGMHQVTALWFKPDGKQQDQIDLKFTSNGPKTENWVSLEFHDLFKEKYPVGPDLTSARLIGRWSVKVLLDGNLLEEMNFYVNCG